MNILKVRPNELYHISLNHNLQGRWKPRSPVGGNSEKSEFTEPGFARISVSPTVGQCFWAIYPNVSSFFEERRYLFLDFAVYAPVFTPQVKFMHNSEIVKNHLVHDAHVTGECFILNEVEMRKVGEIRIHNCTRNKEILYHPFNDKSIPKRFLSHEIDIEQLGHNGEIIPAGRELPHTKNSDTILSGAGRGIGGLVGGLFGLADVFSIF